jgi:hypothetical protein
MADFTGMARDVEHKLWKAVYAVLGREQVGVGDGLGRHSIEDVQTVQGLLWEHVQANRLSGGGDFEGLSECRARMQTKLGANLAKVRTGGYARDGIYNPVSGLGTLEDPSVYTSATIPVSISPFEATALYAGGGLPAIIIDKKSKGLLVNGITFKAYDEGFWNDERLDLLLKEVDKTGFDERLAEGLRDSTIYGGAVLYPVFKKDSVGTFAADFGELLRAGIIGRGCIKRWAAIDRWNTVYVCRYDPTAADYLNPRSIYVPISGIEVSRERCGILRLKQLPYWGAIQQMGWSVSDFEGYIRSVYSYYVLVMSMPIMAQQMSLLLYQMPMDALNAMLGVEQVQALMSVNEEKLREWSILNPKAVNLVGEVKTIDRTFSGYEQFYDAAITDLCARAELPRPLLFHTPNKGFSDNTTESLLKESEMMKMRQKDVEPLLSVGTELLVAHTFGTDSAEWEHRGDIYMSFDKTVVATDKDKAEIGARYSATVNSLKQAGVPTRDALLLAKQFFPSIRLSVEALASSAEAYQREIANGEQEQGRAAGEAGLDMRGGKALNGEAAQLRNGSGGGTTSAVDGRFTRRLTALFKRRYGRELTVSEIVGILEAESGRGE